ncbi:hypothetical protein HCB18_17095 [Salinispora arenicola]|nr:hypothetical protein [Salinispora arenicola]
MAPGRPAGPRRRGDRADLVCEPTIEHLTICAGARRDSLPHVDRWYDAANLLLDPPD